MIRTTRHFYMNREETCFTDPRKVTNPAEMANVMDVQVYDLFFSREVCTCKTDRSINLEIEKDSLLFK